MLRSLLPVVGATVLGAALLASGAGPAQADPPLAEGVQNWSAPGNVAAPTYVTGNPVSAFAANGNTGISVWVEGSDCDDGCNNWAVMASTAKVSGSKVTWGTPVTLSSEYSREPAVAMNSNGSLATVLYHTNSTLVSRTAAVTGTTATWGTEAAIDTDSANQPGKWSLGVSDDGVRMVVAYINDNQDSLKTRTGILSGTTATWGDPTYPLPAPALGSPTAVMSGDGQKALVGATDVDVLQTAYGSTDFSGTPTVQWGSAEMQAAAGNIAAVRLALSDDGGQPNAMWSTSGPSDYAVESASAATARGNLTWGTINTLATGDIDNRAGSPALAASDDGTALTATWTKRTAAAPPQVYSASATVSAAVQTWGSAAAITDDAADAYNPSVGVSGDGTKATLTWFRYDAGQSINRLYSQSGRVDGSAVQTWASPSVLSANAFDTGTENRANITVSSTGTRALAVWRGNSANGPVQAAGGMLFVPAAPTLSLSGNELTITPGTNGSRITSYTVLYTTTSRATSPTANWGIWAQGWPSDGANPISINLLTYQPIVQCQTPGGPAAKCFRPTASGGLQTVGQTRVYQVFADSAEGRSAGSTLYVTLT